MPLNLQKRTTRLFDNMYAGSVAAISESRENEPSLTKRVWSLFIILTFRDGKNSKHIIIYILIILTFFIKFESYMKSISLSVAVGVERQHYNKIST